MEDTFATLIAEGWTEYPSPFPPIEGEKRHFQKRTSSKYICRCNDLPPCVNATWHRFPVGEGQHLESWSLGIMAELSQGQWFELKAYRITIGQFMAVKDAEIDRLIRCWEAANMEN